MPDRSTGAGAEAEGQAQDRLTDLLQSHQAPLVREHTASRPMGMTQLIDPDLGTVESDTLMCMHCQMHWQVQPGSGKQRGWCLNCGGPTCGKQKCEEECVPFMRAIEDMERQSRNYEMARASLSR